MAVGGLVEIVYAVIVERQSLDNIAGPLAAGSDGMPRWTGGPTPARRA